MLSAASPERLKWIGFRLLIAGLIGEAITIPFVPSGILEKALNAFCTGVIAIGVWFEEVGANAIAEPRHLSPKQQQRIAGQMSAFKGLRAVSGPSRLQQRTRISRPDFEYSENG